MKIFINNIILSKLFFIPILMLVFFIPSTVSALTLSPTIINADIEPGQTGAYQIKLYNETESEIFLDGTIEKFIPKGENGEVTILPPEVADVAVTWLKLPTNSLVLKPGEAVSVPLIIEVPKTADVGGYYLATMWETSGKLKTGQNQAFITSRVGSLVLLEVKGETQKNLEVVDFGLKNNQTFYTALPVEFTTRLRNFGNVHLRPQGSIIIKDFLGRTTEAVPFNSDSKAILPNTVRMFESTWGGNESTGIIAVIKNQFTNFNVGRFSAKALIEFNDGKTAESEVIYFWVLPWQLILLVVIGLVILIWVVRKLK